MYSITDVQQPHPILQRINKTLVIADDTNQFIQICAANDCPEEAILITRMYTDTLVKDEYTILINNQPTSIETLEERPHQQFKLIIISIPDRENYTCTCEHLIHYSKTEDDDRNAFQKALAYWESSTRR